MTSPCTTAFTIRYGTRSRNWACHWVFTSPAAPRCIRWEPSISRNWGDGRGLCAFTIGNMIACLSFVGGGILERFPELRVAFLESGAGWPAFWLERIQAGVQGANRGGRVAGLSKSPIEYFQRQCYISADPDDPGIAQVSAVIGDDNIVTATDFGHMEGKGYIHALDEILKLELPADTKRKIMWDNAARLYNLN